MNGDGYEDVLIKRHNYMLFLGGEEMPDEPTLQYEEFPFEEGEDHYGKHLEYGFSLLPDINGDGYDDWAHSWWKSGQAGASDIDGIMIFYGSEEPDFEPDLLLEGHNVYQRVNASLVGGDFNGDGYGDIVTSLSNANFWEGQMNYYFGGEEMGEEADLKINLLENYNLFHMGGHIGAVGDYNGDGSDDLVVYHMEGRNGYVILAGWKNESVDREFIPQPEDYEITFSAYPNPFNSSVNFDFNLSNPGSYTLTILNPQGQVEHVYQSPRTASGEKSYLWSPESLPNGVYFARLELNYRDGSESAYSKLILLK